MIKSPLRYPGGKSKAIKFIAPLIPNFIEYREPFLGGGSVFIYLKQKYPQRKYWINDIYKNLYLFWKYCQENPEALIKQIQTWKDNFLDGKELFQFLNSNMNTFSDLEKAAAFFVFNRITFSGTTESGGYSSAAFQNRFTDSSIKRVQTLSILLKGVKITNYDYQRVIETDGKDVFMFLDPPYFSATKSALYGKNGNLHRTFNHKRLAQILKKTKHKWLMTYDDSDYIRGLYKPFAFLNKIDLVYGMRYKNSKFQHELLISNYKIKFTQDEQLTMF